MVSKNLKSAHWFAAQTHYQREFEAKRELGNQGYDCYLPMFQLPRNRLGVRAIRPLFEGYVFVRECDRWHSINGTRGVQRLLLNGERPSRILDEDVQFFVQCEDEKGYYVDPSVRVRRPGDLVSPRSGRFAGIFGEFVRMTSESRCEVLYWMLGRALRSTHLASDLA